MSKQYRLWFGFAVLALCASSPVFAEDWQVLDDGGISTALSGRAVQYDDGASQSFFTDGRTLYQVSTGTSWGKWWVEGAQYCSTWPPSETPSCYDVETSSDQIRFVDSRGAATLGRFSSR